MKLHLKLGVWIVALLLFVAGRIANAASEGSATGTVYVMSNKAHNNSVLVFQRAARMVRSHWRKRALPREPAQGLLWTHLCRKAPCRCAPSGKVLLAVNPASGDLTAFRVTATGLEFGSKVPSGGAFPVSVTCKGGLVYVAEPARSDRTSRDSK